MAQIRRKTEISGAALKNQTTLKVVSIENLGVNLAVHEIATGTGDFIADGIVTAAKNFDAVERPAPRNNSYGQDQISATSRYSSQPPAGHPDLRHSPTAKPAGEQLELI